MASSYFLPFLLLPTLLHLPPASALHCINCEETVGEPDFSGACFHAHATTSVECSAARGERTDRCLVELEYFAGAFKHFTARGNKINKGCVGQYGACLMASPIGVNRANCKTYSYYELEDQMVECTNGDYKPEKGDGDRLKMVTTCVCEGAECNKDFTGEQYALMGITPEEQGPPPTADGGHPRALTTAKGGTGRGEVVYPKGSGSGPRTMGGKKVVISGVTLLLYGMRMSL